VSLTDLAHLAQTAPGVALVVVIALAVWAYQTGKVHSDREFSRLEEENKALRAENTGLRSALATERTAVNEQAAAGAVNNQLISALVHMAAERRGLPAPVADPSPEELGL
jgi:hypothetical protein